MKDYRGVAGRFEKLLAGKPTERATQVFLKQYPYIVRNSLNAWAWNSVHLLPEFPLGRDYVVDFLILSAHSGAWHTVLVELESPTARPFTKKGNPAKELAAGLAQLDEWLIWINKHEALYRESLSSKLKALRVPARCSNAADHTLAHTEIRDPRTVVHKEQVVVVGRRTAYFDSDTQERRGLFHSRGHHIASYDRFLDMAKNLDPACQESESEES